jgi:hypothetical protein
MTRKRIAEHRFVGDALGSGVEGRRQLLSVAPASANRTTSTVSVGAML